MKDNKKRRKAFIGAIIGAVGSLAGSIIGGINQKKAAKAQAAVDNKNRNLQTAYTDAQNLTEGYGDQDYVDEYNNRITFRCGGRRKKATNGAEIANGILTGGLSIAQGITTPSTAINNAITANASMFANKPKTSIKTTDYSINPIVNGAINTDYVDRSQMLRCGGRKRRK